MRRMRLEDGDDFLADGDARAGDDLAERGQIGLAEQDGAGRDDQVV